MAVPSVLSTYAYLWRTAYAPGISNQMVNDNPLLNMLQVLEDLEIHGSTFYIPCKTTLSSGWQQYGGTTDRHNARDLPSANPGGGVNMTAVPHYAYGTTAMTHQFLVELQKKGAVAQKNWIQEEAKDLRTVFNNIYGAQSYGDGTGKLATVTAYASGTPATLTVDNTWNLVDGSVCDWVTSAGVDVEADITISIINDTQLTFTAAGSPSVTSGDMLVLKDSYGKAPSGLGKLIGTTGTVQNLARTSYRWMLSNVVDNGTADWKPKSFALLTNAMEKHGAMKWKAITTPGIYTAMTWDVIADRRFANLSQKNEAIGRNFTFMGHEIATDSRCDSDTLFAFTPGDLGIGRMSNAWVQPLEDPTTGQASRWSLSSTSQKYLSQWEMSFYSNWTLVAKKFWTHGKITGIYGIENSSATYPDHPGVA